MMALTKKQIMDKLSNTKDTDLFCGSCNEKLEKTVRGAYYCPNLSCVNHSYYDDKGQEVEIEDEFGEVKVVDRVSLK